MANDSWRTPPEVFAYYNKRFNFVLDAAAENSSVALCEQFITPECDAKYCQWGWGRDISDGDWVWLNPPYSNPLPFVNAAVKHSVTKGFGVVMLLNADFSTKWSGLLVRYSSEIHIITGGRIEFIGDNGKPKKGNNKSQAVFIIPPFSHGESSPKTKYISLTEIMGKMT